MFIEALFTIAKTWEQLKCPSTDEWIKKMCVWGVCVCVCVCVYTYIHTYVHTHTTENSAIKENKRMPFAVIWMNLKIIILSKVSQTKKDKYYMI